MLRMFKQLEFHRFLDFFDLFFLWWLYLHVLVYSLLQQFDFYAF